MNASLSCMLRPQAYAILIALCLASHAETAAKKTLQAPLTIQVLDPSTAVIPGALIELRSTETTCTRIAKSGSDGRAATTVLPGRYELKVTMQGFVTAKQRIEVESEGQVINITLKVGSCPECVEVTGGEPASTVTIDIVDSSGRAIPDALVRLNEIIGVSNAHGQAWRCRPETMS